MGSPFTPLITAQIFGTIVAFRVLANLLEIRFALLAVSIRIRPLWTLLWLLTVATAVQNTEKGDNFCTLTELCNVMCSSRTAGDDDAGMLAAAVEEVLSLCSIE